ncbi:MAG: glucose-1-phosphate adenylyltransferase [Chloroflexi bacterium]|nr:glucose-1-phosphate adenylyltransferase [Chloroflexota bacterium]MCI0576513.1 glucose-1-phosphate adenylyltransferase [Chloroflexota bacterium]MCI0650235.1 glucose-1-phosphate adenylyltransferase [Chloroflexota bacterium]MCI0729413.1 glucose-1-phosphate adenylyltransferase [Chloroflexota bacterium]
MDMTNVLGLILGGGQGSRLYPLTKERAKPAVPLAGKYRLIDIPVSNCFHAGIDKIAILTQFNSVSLHRHIYSTYNRDVFAKGWVQILAAEQTPRSVDWYQGTADAVRKQMVEIREAGTDYVLVLAGDHLYRMDYRRFTEFHLDSEADVTIAVQPSSRAEAPSLGILKLSADNLIVRFAEKPKTDDLLDDLVSRDDPEQPYMASMGIYIFRYEAMIELLEQNDGVDFGKHIIPAAIQSHRVVGYIFDDFWEDIGTIRRFYEVNLMMTSADAPFDFFTPDRPIYTHPRFLPGSEVYGGQLQDVLMGDGCRIYDARISHSVVGLRSIIASGVEIADSVLMGADYYETEQEVAENARLGRPNVGVGAGARIRGAIIDKNARIGRNVVINPKDGQPDMETDNWVVRDGIVIIPKGATVLDGTVI